MTEEGGSIHVFYGIKLDIEKIRKLVPEYPNWKDESGISTYVIPTKYIKPRFINRGLRNSGGNMKEEREDQHILVGEIVSSTSYMYSSSLDLSKDVPADIRRLKRHFKRFVKENPIYAHIDPGWFIVGHCAYKPFEKDSK